LRIVYHVNLPTLEGIDKKMKLNKILLWSLLGVCVGWVGMWIFRVIGAIGQPQIEYSEGWNMYIASLFGKGEWQWQMASGPPYTVSFYTPVWYFIMGKITNIFGSSLVVGRIFNLLCTGADMMMVFSIVQHFTKDKLIAVIAALLPITAATMIGWSMYIRVDMLAILFELVGFYLFIRLYEKKSIYFLLSIPFYLLAIFTKQSIAAAAVACTLYLFIQNRKLGVAYGGLLLLLGLAIFATADKLTGGDFYREVILYQRTVPAIRNIGEVISVIMTSMILFLPHCVMAVWFIKEQLTHVVSILIVSAFILNSISLLHPGGNVNYFFETIFTLSIGAGLFLPTILQYQGKAINMIGTSVCFLIMLLVYNFMFGIFPDKGFTARCRTAESLIADASYPIMTENAGLVLDAGKVPYYEPFVFNNLTQLGYFDGNKVLHDLTSNRIEYVITQYKLPYDTIYRFDNELQTAIANNYHIIYDTTDFQYCFVVYEANNRR